MEKITELIERLLEIQSGGRSRSPKLVAEDGQLVDALRKKSLTGINSAPRELGEPERDGHNGSMFICPYCKAKTHASAADVWMAGAAGSACEHCGKEFVIVEGFPLTGEQFGQPPISPAAGD